MNITELMSEQVQSCTGTSTVMDAAKKMSSFDIGAVPIVGDHGTLRGILTDRDIVLRGVAMGKDLAVTNCEDLMSTDVTTASPRMNVHEAMELMADKQVRRLPVVDDRSQVVGMLSIGDLAVESMLVDDAGEALKDISKSPATV